MKRDVMRKAAAMLMLMSATLPAPADELRFTDIHGRTHAIGPTSGRWTLVNVWATWCSVCLEEMPELEALRRERDDLLIVGLAADGQSPQRLKRYAQRLNIGFPIVAGREEDAKRLGAYAYPTTFLFDPQGRVVWFKQGPVRRHDIFPALP